MADEPDKSEKTEDPSEKKLDDAHKRGDVAKSQELTTWFMMVGTAFVFALLAPFTASSLMGQLKMIMLNADQIEVGGPGFAAFWQGLSGTVLVVAIVPLLLMAFFALAANLVQHKPVWSLDPIKPKFSKVSPLQGAKRLFSSEALVNFAKGIAKLSIVSIIMFLVMWPERDRLDTIITADPSMIMPVFQEMGIKIIMGTLAVITVVAGLDFMYQRNKWWEKQKMTIKEIRDEYKQMEGDPKVKAKIRQLRAERGRKRMMAAVPEASVVITNPTHYAIALKYEKGMGAPICLAKGTDAVALKIREVAGEHEIPIVENPPLARALHATVEVEEEIPAEHFKAVAQVIGYVMQLRKSRSWSAN
ncbi:flagellar biosynthesis protein FlhB [Maritalea porphyrae]|jgi:flagellar biosynthetic protein FlhB|uniref:flagellar biosynthesis protein FlhB n=1 Tax=Maritalea porphyrae TaxID=880732 RepID=UPI0022AE5E75|nr:flagellar biosynthesis protein FlhB [Maritalea porphyrae]MCZ4272719.1 flagellar biosynthesis protein FlhB [Maritalea porphyrae]